MRKHTLHPGQKADRSGIYRDLASGERTTIVKGKRVPPTPESGSKWVERDGTKRGK
jgi:hypothetical protein